MFRLWVTKLRKNQNYQIMIARAFNIVSKIFNIYMLPTLIFAVSVIVRFFTAEATEITNNSPEVDVLILGGGIAGITAANYLQSNVNGVTNFLVLEAQDYIGGRLKNRTVGNSTVSEGANWMSFVEQGDENPILVIADILSLTRRVSNYKDIVVKNTVDNDTDFEAAMEELYAAQEKVIENQKKMPLRDDRSLHSSLADAGWLPNTPLKSAIEWYTYDYEYATNAKTISTRLLASDPSNQTDAIVTDPRGYASIIQYLAQNIAGKIKTGQAVLSVTYTAERVEVQTNDGSFYKAKYALCTFSTGVLADKDFVKFTPELPSWKREAINNLPLGYYTFVIVRFEHVFWDDDGYLLNGGQMRAKFPVIFNRNKVQPGSKLLMFTAIGDDALRTETQSQRKTVEEVMGTLREMYPAVNISYPTDVVVSKWVTNPYVRGSYSNPVIGSSTSDFRNLEGRVDNLFFAGEACEEHYFGFLQGGYYTGLRQAKAITNCLRGNECPMYEPEVDQVPIISANCGLIKDSVTSLFLLVILMHVLYR